MLHCYIGGSRPADNLIYAFGSLRNSLCGVSHCDPTSYFLVKFVHEACDTLRLFLVAACISAFDAAVGVMSQGGLAQGLLSLAACQDACINVSDATPANCSLLHRLLVRLSFRMSILTKCAWQMALVDGSVMAVRCRLKVYSCSSSTTVTDLTCRPMVVFYTQTLPTLRLRELLLPSSNIPASPAPLVSDNIIVYQNDVCNILFCM